MLLFDLESFLPDMLVFFVDTVEADAVCFLFGLVLQQDFIQLFSQFVDLGLQFDVLLD